MNGEAWSSSAAAKRNEVNNAIRPQWRLTDLDLTAPAELRNVTQVARNYLTREECTITECDPLAILENIHTGVWTSVAVVTAFCHRAAIAHQVVNCLTEIAFDQAIETAKELDTLQQRTGNLKGPLHGLPVSFMDRFRVAGTGTAAGFVSWIGPRETPESESLIVKCMRRLGAVPLCKTIVPMSLMLGETSNNIMGRVMNPFARHLSAGGAAGGEGALLAMKGSCVGIATEMAGSARIPAAFTLNYALKPSSGRFPITNIASAQPTTPVCGPVAAMLSTDLSSLKMTAKALLGHLPLDQDPNLLEIPWRESEYLRYTKRQSTGRKMRFGILESDCHVSPHPPILRATRMVETALRKAGHEVVEWKPPSHEEAARMLFQIFGADGLREVRKAINQSGEPPVTLLRDWYNSEDPPGMSVEEFWTLCSKRDEYRARYHEYWSSVGVDGVIMPVAATACAEPEKLTYFGYTAVANLLDYAAGTFPVARVDRALDRPAPNANPALSIEDEACRKLYDPDLFHGAPIALQVMCRRLEEEKVLALMQVICAAFQVGAAGES